MKTVDNLKIADILYYVTVNDNYEVSHIKSDEIVNIVDIPFDNSYTINLKDFPIAIYFRKGLSSGVDYIYFDDTVIFATDEDNLKLEIEDFKQYHTIEFEKRLKNIQDKIKELQNDEKKINEILNQLEKI